MNDPITTKPVPGRRSKVPWIIGGVAALVLLVMVGGTATFFWYGMGLFNDQAGAAIRADPAVTEAVGDISGIRLDFMATGEAPGAEEFAYRIEGARASGLLVGRFVTIDAESEELRSGTLTLDDGRTVAIGTARARDNPHADEDSERSTD